MRNSKDTASEICIEINTLNELNELNDIYLSCGFGGNLYRKFHTEFDDDVLYLYLNIKYDHASCSGENFFALHMKNGINPNYTGLDDVYNKWFNFKTDKYLISKILKFHSIDIDIDYNKPRELVYEKYNDKDDSSEICIKINNDKELKELNDLYEEYGFGYGLYDAHTYKFGYNEFIYIFLNFKKTDWSWEEESAYENYFKNGIMIDNESFDRVYNKIFDFKKDYLSIKNTLKNKKISVSIDYNEPKKLVYESILKFKDFYI